MLYYAMLYMNFPIPSDLSFIIFYANVLTNERRQDLYVGEALSQRAPQRETPGKNILFKIIWFSKKTMFLHFDEQRDVLESRRLENKYHEAVP